MNSKRLIVTLTGGGFRWEAESLIGGLGADFEYHYVTHGDSRSKPKPGLPDGPIHLIKKITTMSEKGFLRQSANFLRSFRDAWVVINRVKPDAIICVGTSAAVALCLCGKLKGIRTIYIESITRISKASLTGRLLSVFRLCDRHYVQWPEATRLYRRAIYRGTVL